MKPTVISNANASASSSAGGPQGTGNGVTIPINHEFSGHPQPQYHTLPTSYGSPGSHARAAQQQPQQQQQIPAHFQQDFDFEPDMGMDMFPRSSRLGRMTHDPFGDFGGNSHFGFPQFNSLGRRRVNSHNDDDFFNRLPSEFRQYIPESFAQRRAGATAGPAAGPNMAHPQQQQPPQQQTPPHFYNTMPQSPSKKVCDAAIQTEDPTGRSEVDHGVNSENLNQHGLRNTMDMGVKSAAENEMLGTRSSSAPPTEQQQQQQYMQQTQQPYYPQQQQHQHQQSIPVNGKRPTPPPQQQHQQFATQTSPQVQTPGGYSGQAPPFQKVYYPPHQQAHPQQKQHTPPPPQTPGGTYIRSIPIFVEGRSEPIINNKEIPNQNAPPNASSASASARGFTPPKQQQQPQSHRLTPLNTQQQPSAQSAGLPPHTPHTVDTINKIQDIQRDVLALMSRVEQFTGTRADKEYVYLDEMLTRNLLKLDNIDTNGKESIRLARREAIKCIEASINVLEAKAEENKKAALAAANGAEVIAAADPATPQKSGSGEKVAKETTQTTEEPQPEEPIDANKIQEPIPLPPPESQKFNMVQIEDCPEDESTGLKETNKESSPKPEEKKVETAAETK